jgi:hypothetical protein
MVHGLVTIKPNKLPVKTNFSPPKIKNRNGFPEKRITEFDNTLGVKECQRESPSENKRNIKIKRLLDSSIQNHDRNEQINLRMCRN